MCVKCHVESTGEGPQLAQAFGVNRKVYLLNLNELLSAHVWIALVVWKPLTQSIGKTE